MNCPLCGRENPASALHCTCGYRFESVTPEPLAQKVKESEDRLSQLHQELEGLNSRFEELKRELSELRSVAAPPAGAESTTAPVVKASSQPAPARERAEPHPAQAPPPQSAPLRDPVESHLLPSTEPSAQSTHRPPEWEALIGGNWLLKIGILAIVLGALYFLKYAFENQWIGDTGRVLIGVFSGLGLLYGGEVFQKRHYQVYGQTLAGGGISILYLSIYAAFNFYTLLSQLPGLLFMVLVTAACCLLSVRYVSKTLAVLGLLGGLLTPYWLDMGTANQVSLLTYLLILDLGIGWLALRQRWFLLNALSLAGTALLFVGWVIVYYTREALWTTEIFLILFAALYVFLSEHMRAELEKAKSPDSQWAMLLTPTLVAIFFFSSQAVLAHNTAYFWGFLLIFDGLALAAATLIAKSNHIASGVLVLNLLGIQQWVSTSYAPSDQAIVWGCLNGLWVLFLGQSVLRQKVLRSPVDSVNVLVSLGIGFGYFRSQLLSSIFLQMTISVGWICWLWPWHSFTFCQPEQFRALLLLLKRNP